MEPLKEIEEVETCSVCMEMLNQPMKCKTCKKYICRTHAVILTKCPTCRSQPFDIDSDHELQEKLSVLRNAKRQIQKDTTKFQCHGKNCKFSGNYEEMIVHHQAEHPYIPFNMVAYGDFYTIQEKDPIENVSESERKKASYAITNLKVPPEGQKKKIVNYFQALKMIRHCNICTNNRCYTLYSGPWGSFIGGVMGRTHFDLTDCPKGKTLNQAAGWKYSDPRN